MEGTNPPSPPAYFSIIYSLSNPSVVQYGVMGYGAHAPPPSSPRSQSRHPEELYSANSPNAGYRVRGSKQTRTCPKAEALMMFADRATPSNRQHPFPGLRRRRFEISKYSPVSPPEELRPALWRRNAGPERFAIEQWLGTCRRCACYDGHPHRPIPGQVP